MSGQHTSRGTTFLMWFYISLCFIVPLVIISIANVCIVRALKKRKRTNMIRVQREVTIEAQGRKEARVTVMLLIVTLVFLILLLPLFVCHMHRYLVLNHKRDARTKAISLLSWNVCEKLWYANSSVNFYLYSLFGTEFRRELKELFCRKNRVGFSTTAETSQNTAT